MVTAIEGVGTPAKLHPVQAAFLTRTPSSAATARRARSAPPSSMLDEAARGEPSYVTASHTDGSTPPRTPEGSADGQTNNSLPTQSPELPDDEIRERMSGNLCRCGAYVNIVAAIRQALEGDQSAGTHGRPATESAIPQPTNGMDGAAESATGQTKGRSNQSGMNRAAGETGQPE